MLARLINGKANGYIILVYNGLWISVFAGVRLMVMSMLVVSGV